MTSVFKPYIVIYLCALVTIQGVWAKLPLNISLALKLLIILRQCILHLTMPRNHLVCRILGQVALQYHPGI